MYFYLATFACLVIDQITKYLALNYLEPRDGVEIFRGFFRLYFATNTGGAFSILSDKPALLVFFSTAAAVFIFAWHFTIPRRDWIMQIALGMVFGGAIGNLVDRFSRGFVIDFFDFHWRYQIHWPTFNFADTFICIGVGIIALCVLLPKLHQKIIGKSAVPPGKIKI